MPGSFMDQRQEEVRKQSKKTIYFLQMSPRKASLRQGNMLMHLFQQYTGGQGYEQRHFSLTVRQRGAGFPEVGHYV